MAWTTWRSAWVRGSIVIAMAIGACEVDDDGNDDGATGNDDGATGNDDGATGSDDGATGNGDGDTGGGDACDMCGEAPCSPPPSSDESSCFDEAFCVPPADDACVTCMMTNCPDSVGATCGSGGAFDCVDYAKTIGGCGDAEPYAGSHYECMVMSCDAECSPGEGFTACACI